MREILFRGKRIDNGEWVYGDFIQLHDGRKYIVNNVHGACIDDKGNFINTEEPFVCAVYPETVGQYTGLKDKNGVRIFEGDVGKQYFEGVGTDYDDGCSYRYDYDGHKIGEVTFSGTGANLKCYSGELVVDGEIIEGWKPSRRSKFAAYRCEVIGNIHDNKELLQEGA